MKPAARSEPGGKMTSPDLKPTALSRPVPILAFVFLAVLTDQIIKIAVEAYLRCSRQCMSFPIWRCTDL